MIAWRVWRHNRGTDIGRKARENFRDWAHRDFDIGQGHVSGSEAAIEILLPIAAVAFGMTAFAIIALTAG